MAWDDKETKVWMDGEFVEWKDANISVLSHVVHYGTSVFEGIRAYSNENGVAVFRLKEHVRRLFDSAKIYSIPIPYTEEEIADAIKLTVKENNYTWYSVPEDLEKDTKAKLESDHKVFSNFVVTLITIASF